MKDSGEWWYDKSVALDMQRIQQSRYADMLSPAFWLVRGLGFKITCSDDPHNTPLLRTTGNCLGGQTIRQKMESYGHFMTAREIAMFNMVASFKQPMDSDKLHAMDHFKTQHKSASGATGAVVMEQC